MIIVREHLDSIFPSASLPSDCRDPAFILFQKKKKKKKEENHSKPNHFNINKVRYISLGGTDSFKSLLTATLLRSKTLR